MPLDFPAGPSHGAVYTANTTQWVFSSSDNAWNIDRTAIVDTTDGLVSGTNFSNNAIEASNLNITAISLDNVSTDTTTTGNNTDIIESAALPTGFYYFAAQITYRLSGATEANYTLSIGPDYVSTPYIENEYASYGNIENTIVVGKFMTNSSAANTLKLKAWCTSGSIETIGSGSISYTSIYWVRLGGL